MKIVLNILKIGKIDKTRFFSQNVQKFKHIPKIIGVSGKTEQDVSKILDDIEKQRGNKDYVESFWNEEHNRHKQGHLFRGFILLQEPCIKKISKLPQTNSSPVVFLYPGAGFILPGMGRDLMKLDKLTKLIRKFTKTLKHDFNLEEAVINANEAIYKDKNGVIMISMQVVLTHILKVIGVKHDFILGHSMGEFSAGYADGCLTAEQIVLMASEVNKIFEFSDLPPMVGAIVGLNKEEFKRRAPPELKLACENSTNRIAIGGPSAIMEKFIDELKAEHVFARVFENVKLVFHTEYIHPEGPKLEKVLKRFIPNPKPRSKSWLSTSFQESEWTTPLAQLCSAEYLTHNFMNVVHFASTLEHIPKNSIVIEIAPFAMYKRSVQDYLGPEANVLSLLEAGEKNTLEFFLLVLGELYLAGAASNLSNLYLE